MDKAKFQSPESRQATAFSMCSLASCIPDLVLVVLLAADLFLFLVWTGLLLGEPEAGSTEAVYHLWGLKLLMSTVAFAGITMGIARFAVKKYGH